ncbi:hypothetical protein OJ998_22585, partial [Solirubrobacter taibaiensis]|nr:hypothetical protein [Solirubrobacter taibaiensis]
MANRTAPDPSGERPGDGQLPGLRAASRLATTEPRLARPHRSVASRRPSRRASRRRVAPRAA